MDRCDEVTEEVPRHVFHQQSERLVMLEGIILKPNIVLPGAACAVQETVDAVARATIGSLRRFISAAVPGVAFLSGGQSAERASARLNAMDVKARLPGPQLPWSLTFSSGRAPQQPALSMWHGEVRNVAAAARALLHRARCSKAALVGGHRAALEQQEAPVPA